MNMPKQKPKSTDPVTLDSLKIGKGGRLVFACYGDFRGQGRQKLILHNAQLHVGPDGEAYYSYGDGNAMAVSITGRPVNSKQASAPRKS